MTGTGAPGDARRSLIAGSLIFLVIVLVCWKAHVISHEMIYLLGSRRVADPSLLSRDFTWSVLPPTSFLFDHLLAPLWSLLGEFAIVNLGRFVSWLLMAWSIVALSRALSIPAWSAVVGFSVWLLWGQTLGSCGSPLEAFQVKSFSYPLLFFALASVVHGKVLRAGLAAGLATAFHIIVGGWGCLALFAAMLLDRKRFPLRRIAVFLLATAPFILPVVSAVALFHEGGMSGEDRQWMDEIYVTIAAPSCCDLDYFMNAERWLRAGVVFVLATLVVWTWPAREAGRILRGFVGTLILFFLLAEVAERLELYWFLKVFPCQLGASLPALFLFLLLPAWIKDRPLPRAPGAILAALALAGAVWLAHDRGAFRNLIDAPRLLLAELRKPRWGGPPDEPEYGDPRLYAWIKTHTPRDAVFITPFIKDFWTSGERAQIASRRHPPFDHRLIEWTERLTAINELDLEGNRTATESDLTLEELRRIRERYGATHYLTEHIRVDLADRFLYSTPGNFVYDLEGLGPL